MSIPIKDLIQSYNIPMNKTVVDFACLYCCSLCTSVCLLSLYNLDRKFLSIFIYKYVSDANLEY